MASEPKVAQDGEAGKAAEPAQSAGGSPQAQGAEAQAEAGKSAAPEKGAKPGPGAASEGAEAPTAEPEPRAATAAPPQLDRVLKHIAQRAGVSDEMIEKLGEGAIPFLRHQKEMLDSLSARWAEIGRKQMEGAARPGEAHDPRGAGAASEPIAASQPAAARQATGEPFRFTQVKRDELEESTGELVKAMESDIGKALGSLRVDPKAIADAVRQQIAGEFQPVVEFVQQQRHAANETMFNEFFRSIEGDYGDVFGVGPTARLAPESPHYRARLELLAKADQIAMGMRSAGVPFTFEDVVTQALSVTQSERMRDIARESLRTEIKARASQVSPRPAQRVPSEAPPGRDRAIQALRARMASHRGGR